MSASTVTTCADGYHQVMLATRELSPELPAQAQTWVNQYLQFTHGYGLVMSFVSKTIGGGFPQYLLENVPAESAYGLNITQPAIYYGESMPGYRIVATGIKEFDYPKGNDNVYTSYTGTGGIPLDSFWKKLLFAWTQSDVNILLTSYLRPESRIQIWRTVQERVAQIAPFLRLDSDPYPVLSAGKLYWIQDAYTDSDQFPYSDPHRAGFGNNLNYIRNSVKVVVDMYDGTVQFYVMDPEDPVLAVYRRAFPGVFKDLDQLSPDLKAHLRYPEDLFAIQADEYRTFHMTDPQVFYNREDLWVVPKETYAGQSTPMQPYYILMKLPGSDQLEYLLMTPFTPQNRDNMISWMAARCDFPEYGKMLFYQLPKDKLIYGPNQIEAMINQNTTISQQLTLWNQQGSRVIRGTTDRDADRELVPVHRAAVPASRRHELSAAEARHRDCRRQGRDGAHARRGAQRPFRHAATRAGIIAAANLHPRSRRLAQARTQLERPGRHCSRGTGQNLERRWRDWSTSWPGRRHGEIRLHRNASWPFRNSDPHDPFATAAYERKIATCRRDFAHGRPAASSEPRSKARFWAVRTRLVLGTGLFFAQKGLTCCEVLLLRYRPMVRWTNAERCPQKPPQQASLWLLDKGPTWRARRQRRNPSRDYWRRR